MRVKRLKSWMLRGGLVGCAVLAPLGGAYAKGATGTLFSAVDPAGDARGDGNATLPTRPAISEAALDITRFTARSVATENGKPQLQLRTEFADIGDPWGGTFGFSAQTLDIFIRTGPGGEPALTGLNLRAEEGGWQYQVHVTGFGALLSAPLQPEGAGPAAPLPAPRLHLEGNTVVVDTGLPAGEYLYWVTSSVFSPFSEDGLLRPNAGGGDFAITTPLGDANAPVPLDVLLPEDEDLEETAAERTARVYALGRLPAAGHLRNLRPWWLAGLGVGGLLLSAGSAAALWRKR